MGLDPSGNYFEGNAGVDDGSAPKQIFCCVFIVFDISKTVY